MAIDGIIILCIIIFVWKGATQGILLSLLGPACFIFAAIAGMTYYQYTHNAGWALGIALLGPFLLHFIFSSFLRMLGIVRTDKEPSLISMLLGAAITAAWGLSFVIPILIMVMIVPGMESWTKDSRTCWMLQPVVDKFTAGPTQAPGTPATDPIDALVNDPRMKAVLEDPAMAQAAEKGNYSAMMTNPKIFEMVQDPAFLKKLMAAYKQILVESDKLRQQKTPPPAEAVPSGI